MPLIARGFSPLRSQSNVCDFVGQFIRHTGGASARSGELNEGAGRRGAGLSTLFLRQGFLLAWNSPSVGRLAGHQATVRLCLAQDYKYTLPCLDFSHGFWGSNWGPDGHLFTCAVSPASQMSCSSASWLSGEHLATLFYEKLER